jgi:squalene-associated FAD-dependent desaturase
MSARRIAVIGGGLAGIAAALDCSRAGASVTLLESRGRLGGAAYSFTREGIRADNGQHVFLRCCTAYRELLEELAATDLVTLQSRLEIPVLAPNGKRAWLRRSGLPAPLHLGGTLARYRFLTPRQRLAVATAMTSLRKVDYQDPAADARSFGDWLREHSQDSDTIDILWGLIVRPTLNLEPSDASLAQAAQVFQVGLLRDRSAGDIGYAKAPLSEIHDVAARRTLLHHGVEVRLRHGATTIVPTDDGFQIEISGAPTLSADVVVVAVPPDRAARLLPAGAGPDHVHLARLGRSPIVNVHVVYDRRVMELPFAAAVKSPVQWVFDRTESSGIDSGQYLVVSLSAADEELEMTVEELRARYLPALAELFPAAASAAVEAFFVTREHSATFRASPGARALRPGAETPLRGLVLAGSWTDTGWPATMEGAVRSGRAAAQAALLAPLRSASRQPVLAPPATVNGNGGQRELAREGLV